MGDPVVLLIDTRSEEELSSVVMVERLWSRLPEELVEKILTWLPLPSLFRCRAVCKKWNTLMFSKDFHSTGAHGSSQMPLLLLFGLETGRSEPSYDALTSCWHKLPRSFLPYVDVHPLVSAGGLILCVRSILKKLDYSCLCVCNPLTKSWRDLPVTIRLKAPMLVSMIYNRYATSFRVIVAGGRRFCNTGSSLDQVGESQDDSSNYCWRTHVYDSLTDSWRDAGHVPQGSCLRPTTAVLNGWLYALRQTGEILSYDVEKGVWRDLKVPVPTCCDVACLTGTCATLYLAGYAKEQGVQSLRIWWLNLTVNKWHEIGRLPHELYVKLMTFSKDSVRLVAQGLETCCSPMSQGWMFCGSKTHFCASGWGLPNFEPLPRVRSRHLGARNPTQAASVERSECAIETVNRSHHLASRR